MSTFQPSKEAVEAKRNELQKQVQQGFAALLEEVRQGKTARYLELLAVASKFHKYSLHNQVLIAMQRPTATRVAGYATWQRLGYQVRKGEKGIKILAPRPYQVAVTDEETGEEQLVQRLSFTTVNVFDVSQLAENSEKPLPVFFIPLQGDHEALYERLARVVTGDGIAIEEVVCVEEGASWGGRITLKAGKDSTSKFLTLAHEYAHELLHKNPESRAMSRGKRECQAEAISYIVAHHFGVYNPFSSDYLQMYGNSERELVAELEVVHATAARIIDAMECGIPDVLTPDRDAA